MTRPTGVYIETTALVHNLNQVKRSAPNSKVIAMVKANAYGCGLKHVVPVLEGKVYAFGVACLEEALAIRHLGAQSHCLLFQGVFQAEEWYAVAEHRLQAVIHHRAQLESLLANPLPQVIKVWVKVDTGMHRLGFLPEEIYEILCQLEACPWVEPEIGLMTHFACADQPTNPANQSQLQIFKNLHLPDIPLLKSISNSAGILSLPMAHADVVRPGIMLYGVSPFIGQSGQSLGLRPVMHFRSAVSAIHLYPAGTPIGYGGIWATQKISRIGVVAVGYGDGYPRHIAANTLVWIKGHKVPIVGHVSMDMLTIDLTEYPEIQVGEPVELWGRHISIESVALAAGTIPYELLCQFSPRILAN